MALGWPSWLVPKSLRFQLTGGADDEIFAVTSTIAIINSALLVNVASDPTYQPAPDTPVNAFVSVAVVPSGETLDVVAGSHRILSYYLLEAGDTGKLDELEGRILAPGDAIWARADAPSGTPSVAQTVNFSLGLLIA